MFEDVHEPDDQEVSLTDRVLELVDAIPPGKVLSYSDVGALLGVNAPRAIGRIMATDGGEVAWWRVVRADGRPPAGHEPAAIEQYRAEGTPLNRTGTKVAPDAFWEI